MKQAVIYWFAIFSAQVLQFFIIIFSRGYKLHFILNGLLGERAILILAFSGVFADCRVFQFLDFPHLLLDFIGGPVHFHLHLFPLLLLSQILALCLLHLLLECLLSSVNVFLQLLELPFPLLCFNFQFLVLSHLSFDGDVVFVVFQGYFLDKWPKIAFFDDILLIHGFWLMAVLAFFRYGFAIEGF
jgi:hypothetical protein